MCNLGQHSAEIVIRQVTLLLLAPYRFHVARPARPRGAVLEKTGLSAIREQKVVKQTDKWVGAPALFGFRLRLLCLIVSVCSWSLSVDVAMAVAAQRHQVFEKLGAKPLICQMVNLEHPSATAFRAAVVV